MEILELLLHPIRIRIVNAFSGDRSRTTSQVCARLPDVSQATVYRHVALLGLHYKDVEDLKQALRRVRDQPPA